MVEMKNIKGQPTLELDANNLNIVMSCPYCNTTYNRIIHGTKKWKCLDCHKSFKKSTGSNISNIQNIKTFNNTEIEKPTLLTDIVPDPELVKFLNKLPNGEVPSINSLTVDKERNNPLITNSKEIETYIQSKKSEITSQIQGENKTIMLSTEELIKTGEIISVPKKIKKRTIIRKNVK